MAKSESIMTSGDDELIINLSDDWAADEIKKMLNLSLEEEEEELPEPIFNPLDEDVDNITPLITKYPSTYEEDPKEEDFLTQCQRKLDSLLYINHKNDENFANKIINCLDQEDDNDDQVEKQEDEIPSFDLQDTKQMPIKDI